MICLGELYVFDFFKVNLMASDIQFQNFILDVRSYEKNLDLNGMWSYCKVSEDE